MPHHRHTLLFLVVLAVLSGCRAPAEDARAVPRAATQPVAVQQRPLAEPTQPCSDRFIAHDLDFIATLPGSEARMFDANGAGVAIGDLDEDGLLDLVLANQRGPNTILWNQGALRFRAVPMQARDSRAVNLVDVDGDGRLDVVFTQRRGGPNWWRNTEMPSPLSPLPLRQERGVMETRFARELLPGVVAPAYAMTWGDVNGDDRLDLVTGSYDAELLTENGNSFLMGNNAGVYVYTNEGDRFAATRLAHKAQALAVALYDLDGDGQRDIVVGSDFAAPDGAWRRAGDGWDAAAPFRSTSHSTMSFDVGDSDNDGTLELFSTDMKPYANDVATLAHWQPIIATLWEPLPADDPQAMENALQVPDGRGGFRNEAYARGIDATGWSWSGAFGDLDRDSWLDLYVVNGMQERELFGYLPGHELIERNQALRNDGTGRFVPQPSWALGATAGGRGMSMADLDGDGDLDIVVNNLAGPAQLFENRLCGGISLLVDLRWPGSRNTRALGATVTLHTSAGSVTRDVRASSGYLSGAATQLHFGVPAGATLHALEIQWPDGARSLVDAVQAHTLVTVVRR